MCVLQARYDEVLEHGRVLDSGEFKSHPYPIGEYWEKKDGIKVRAIVYAVRARCVYLIYISTMQVRMIRDFKAMQQWTATLLTVEGSKNTIAAIRAKKVLSVTCSNSHSSHSMYACEGKRHSGTSKIKINQGCQGISRQERGGCMHTRQYYLLYENVNNMDCLLVG